MKAFKQKKIYRALGQIFALALMLPFIANGQSKKDKKITYYKNITNGIKSPLRLTAASENANYMSDFTARRICRYDSSGNLTGQINVPFSPLCIAAFNEKKLYVGDAQSGKITIIDSCGTVLKTFGALKQPSDAVFDDNHLLYVVDSKNAHVAVFNPDGVFLRSFGENVLNFPTGIAFDNRNQRILVAEHGGITPPDSSGPTAKIHLFNKNGQWLTCFGDYGNKNGRFTRIQGMTVDSFGRIFAVDSYQGVITVLDEQGEFLGKIGEYGAEAGELRLPMDVILDSQNRLWMTALNNSSINVFDINNLPTGIGKDPAPMLPLQSRLLQNFPNPFNPGTQIPFVIGKDENVKIYIYNLAGQKVRSVHLGFLIRGEYLTKGKAYYWDGKNDAGRNVASGFYLYELRTDSFNKVRRMLLLK